jgi:prepilin-type N-terminal cleavage/methylation domain-containing protein
MKTFKSPLKSALVPAAKRSGFTLIEMLVVVSVIGILVSIAGYNNSRVLKNSRDAALKVELNQLRTAVFRFSLDNGGNFPSQLNDLSGDELKMVPSKWRGTNAGGHYHYDAQTGAVLLFDEASSGPSEKTDLSGKKYGDY